MDADLLPCPFCGSEAEMIDERLRFFIKCKSCGVVGPLIRWRGEFDYEGAGSPTATDVAIWKAEATKLWNTRARTEQKGSPDGR